MNRDRRSLIRLASGCGVVAALVALAPPRGEAAPPPAVKATPPARAWDVAGLPLVYYQPETSLGLGAQLVLVRSASSGEAAQDRHDTISLLATATRRRQYGLSVSIQNFWNQDRDRSRLDLVAQRFPNTFWGLGNSTPERAADAYTPILVGGQLALGHRVFEQVFAGLTVVSGYDKIETFAPGGAVADYLTTRPRQGWLVGIGPTLSRDTRDDSNFPRAGSTSSLSLTAYRRGWLSDYQFVEIEADHRAYFGLPWTSVLVVQGWAQDVIGEPPIELLPALGGPERLRGYFQGRYRDKVYAMAQIEWRVPLFWRIGGALFAAGGDVFPDLGHLAEARLKAAGGGGLRVNVGQTQRVNIRVDGAVAPGSTGLYLTIGEAI